MDNTKIQWTDATWNPIRGCSRVSEGCRNCYAERVAARFSWPVPPRETGESGEIDGTGAGPYAGLAKMTKDGPRWTGAVNFIEDALDQPLRWKRPRRIFVNSMSDLFHENVSQVSIDLIFSVMALTPRHTYQVLTKRPDRMLAYMMDGHGIARDRDRARGMFSYIREITRHRVLTKSGLEQLNREHEEALNRLHDGLPNLWMGVSVENQEAADKRIPILLKTPAAVRWISAEPLLGPLDLSQYLPGGWGCSSCGYRYRDSVGRCKGLCQDPSGKSCDAMACPRCGKFHYWTGSVASLDWVVVGGESGPGARPFDLAWACKIVSQCRGASTPVFVKQLGSMPITDNANLFDFDDHVRLEQYGSTAAGCRLILRDRKGGDMSEWPTDLMHQESPKVAQPKEK